MDGGNMDSADLRGKANCTKAIDTVLSNKEGENPIPLPPSFR